MLYLFSSNAQPQYSQDILNVLAAPSRSIVKFRYSQEWIDDETKGRWEHLSGESVLIHFSLQQKFQLHEPVLFPIRSGVVVRKPQVIGDDIFIVEFSLGEYVALSKPINPVKFSEVPGNYRAALDSAHIEHPYLISATTSEVNALEVAEIPADSAADQLELFQRTVKYFSQTDVFTGGRFFYISDLNQLGHEEAVAFDEGTGSFVFIAGRTYTIQIVQSQPDLITAVSKFDVSTDKSVLAISGPSSFEITSEYDAISITIAASATSGHDTVHTEIQILPDQGVIGPSLRIPIDVKPNTQKAIGTTLGTMAGLGALAVPAVWTSMATPWKFIAIIFGGGVAAYLSVLGWNLHSP